MRHKGTQQLQAVTQKTTSVICRHKARRANGANLVIECSWSKIYPTLEAYSENGSHNRLVYRSYKAPHRGWLTQSQTFDLPKK